MSTASAGVLEPRPDPMTGLPRPWGTRGPGSIASGTPPPRRPPPEGRGPALEWVHNRPRTVVLVFGSIFLYVVVLLTIASRGFSWLSAWGFWVFAAVLVALVVRGAGAAPVAAGADWLQVGGRWVDLYDLTRIRARGPGKTLWYLRDRGGRRVTVSMETLSTNPDVWPLVRNGIEHSAAAGAELNRRAKTQIGLR